MFGKFIEYLSKYGMFGAVLVVLAILAYAILFGLVGLRTEDELTAFTICFTVAFIPALLLTPLAKYLIRKSKRGGGDHDDG